MLVLKSTSFLNPHLPVTGSLAQIAILSHQHRLRPDICRPIDSRHTTPRPNRFRGNCVDIRDLLTIVVGAKQEDARFNIVRRCDPSTNAVETVNDLLRKIGTNAAQSTVMNDDEMAIATETPILKEPSSDGRERNPAQQPSVVLDELFE